MFGALRLSPSRSSMVGFALIILSSNPGGCKKPAEITRYQVPKEKPPAPPISASPSKSKTPGQDRMLAAIVPHGENAWSFKLAGKATEVDKHAEAFETLVKSVTFPE